MVLLFLPDNQANIMKYKMELNNLKKSVLSMFDYVHKVKNLVDSLGFAGHNVSTKDQIMHIILV